MFRLGCCDGMVATLPLALAWASKFTLETRYKTLGNASKKIAAFGRPAQAIFGSQPGAAVDPSPEP